MTRSSRAPLLVQRRVIDGDVIVVRPATPRQGQETRRAAEARPEWVEEARPERVAEARPERAVPDEGAEAGAPPEPQPYTTAPPGYAYEFGTWRLVPVD